MTNGNRCPDFEIKRLGCDKEIFVEIADGEEMVRQLFISGGEEMVRQLFITVNFASSTVAKHSKDPSRYVEFGLCKARVNVDLGEHAAISLAKPFLTGKFLRSSTTVENTENEDRQSQQKINGMESTVSFTPSVGGKDSTSDNVSSGKSSSIEQTVERSHVEFVPSASRSDLQWLFTAPANMCLSGALQHEALCFVGLKNQKDYYIAISQIEALHKDVALHEVPDDFYEGLNKVDAQLEERRLKKMIAQKISSETYTNHELNRLLDKDEVI